MSQSAELSQSVSNYQENPTRLVCRVLWLSQVWLPRICSLCESEKKLRGRSVRPLKNWEVGRFDLSVPRGRPLLAHNSETISQNHIKFGVSRVNILDYSVINFQVNRTYPSRVIAVGSWVRFCVDSFFSPPFITLSTNSFTPVGNFLHQQRLYCL